MAHNFKTQPELTNNQMQFYYWDSPHKQIVEGFMARVVKVTDGDTVRVFSDLRSFDFPIRMSRIQAKEMGEGGEQSKNWLEKQILGNEVYIQINPNNRVGKFGRLIGDVIQGGQSMSDLSLMMGQSIIFGSD